MYRISIALTLLAFLLLSACAANKQESHLTGLEKLSVEQRGVIDSGSNDFNTQATKTIVAESHQAYSIEIIVRTQDEMNAIEPAMTGPNSRFGHATEHVNSCTIELSQDILTADQKEEGTSVVMHELAHCMGLKHVDGEDEVMSPVVVQRDLFSADALGRFSKTLQLAIGIRNDDNQSVQASVH